MPKAVFIGSANMDTVIRLTTEFPEKFTEECENGVESITRTAGGKGLNQVLTFKKQNPNADVHFIGCIGGIIKKDENDEEIIIPDDSGKKLVETLEEFDIGIEGLKLLPGVKTDGRIINVDKNGQNRMMGYGSAIKQLTPEMLMEMETILEGADIIAIQLKMPLETVRFVIEYCEKHNVKLLIDPTPLDRSKMLTENNCELLKKATYLSPNEEEAFALAMYAAGKDVDEVKSLFSTTTSAQRTEMIKTLVKTSPNIFATMGGDGVIFSRDGKLICQDTYPTVCRDSTGAGDTFNGAFLASISRNEDYSTAILYGLMASSIKVREEGAQNGVPSGEKTKQEIENSKTPNFIEDGSIGGAVEEIQDEEIKKIGTQHSTDDTDGDEPR